MDGKKNIFSLHPQKVKFLIFRIMIEPSIMNKMLNFHNDYKKDKLVKAEDYINKKDLLAHDIFCLVFMTLNICQSDFVGVYSYLTDHDDCIIKFDREKFKMLMDNFFLDF